MYPKLVRDNIPDIITSDDKTVVYRKLLDDKEYIEQLNNKLLEVAEYMEAKDKDNIKEELSDILEVVYSIGKVYNISEIDLSEYRTYKSNIKGNFSKRIFVEEVK